MKRSGEEGKEIREEEERGAGEEKVGGGCSGDDGSIERMVVKD